MKKFIVTTTINAPTIAIKKFSEKKDWQLIVVADLKTPKEKWGAIDCLYYSPEDQDKDFPQISEALGWNNIQRRNMGFLKALALDAEIIATVDDDNIPYDSWGDDLLIGKEIECDLWKGDHEVFDPLSIFDDAALWHRGYPIEFVPKRRVPDYQGKASRKIEVQAGLWDGDPDIDAIARLSQRPTVKYPKFSPFAGVSVSPFNSQNTFLSRTALKKYAMVPFVGRMDDIWGGYLLQSLIPDALVYTPATVYQARNEQNLVDNLSNELLGYRHTLDLLRSLPSLPEFVPEKSRKFLDIYFAATERFD